MKAKQSKQSLAERYHYRSHTVDLSQQERRALSLVWSEPDEARPLRNTEQDTEHCAVLGYN
ncbi:hypothetical protein H1D31_10500 [Alishewanella sp. BS5-314]|jgi:hypothetical protein|uniref:hypothetical protein n=1 Tax=Alishewanella sp. BS5-314 TaxID=2755587 RepID=UPI0021BA66F1|nr:hypothetical protein [Alishewanella sp. BS5-314]MCT8126445.1 hypothetical protein [Alishewanella sp. BS5-314]